ncbi:hypothetical protein ANO14919_131470 [Xylariales sp. No.14919]|nr:hypothetical protein ANO14919_131470 [Xylariales sp. No.14919]
MGVSDQQTPYWEWSDDFFDVVATQGANLIAPPRTPVWEKRGFNEEFADTLTRKLKSLNIEVMVRTRMYGKEAADEWPARFTPPDIRAEYGARIKALREGLKALNSDPSSDELSDSWEEDVTIGGKVVRKKFSIAKPWEEGWRSWRWPSTPPESANGLRRMAQGKKRRRSCTEGNEEEDNNADDEGDGRRKKARVTSPAQMDWAQKEYLRRCQADKTSGKVEGTERLATTTYKTDEQAGTVTPLSSPLS